MLLCLTDVCRTYRMGSGEVLALNKVSFSVEPGEFISVMGASGSGKSTLLHIIGCLHKPTSGTYMLENMDVRTLKDNQLARIRNGKIGFVFQTYNLLPRLTALRNVEIPLVYKGYPKSERRCLARLVLDTVGLTDRLYHKPSQLSGGQQQKVAIARALVTNPAILLADEPTGNLDSSSGSDIMKILAGLNEKGITIILVTHEHDLAQYARRIITIRDGRIASDAPSDGLILQQH
jgi:putative ABC transport system ATP-binding protein